ncbi:MAG: LptF/LptG family permease [Chitinophagales bacterium]|nr:LptF/LptG family permease [Chitinophagales bacterium]
MLKTLDRYIIKKFLSTFIVALAMFILIAIVFDVVEKLEDFLSKQISLKEIIFDYYLNFIPYFAVLYTPLFLFIAVIFFTSRMAYRSEIVSVLNSGITFNRLLVPYFISALAITALNIYANMWIIPDANKTRFAFEDAYIGWKPHNPDNNLHFQIAKNEFMYIENFNLTDSSGYKFAYEKFNNGKLIYKLRADRLQWNAKNKKWLVKNYAERTNDSLKETLRFGKDSLIKYNFTPNDLKRDDNAMEALNATELDEKIAELKMRGADDISFYEIEKYKRTAFPFAIPILTLIGVSLSSRKVRGGSGLHIGIGIALSFSYIMFQQVSKTFSTNGNLPAIIGVWIPNVVYGTIAVFLYRLAPK